MELPWWGAHFALAPPAVAHHPQFVGLAGGEVIDVHFQFVAHGEVSLVGLSEVLVRLPHLHLKINELKKLKKKKLKINLIYDFF